LIEHAEDVFRIFKKHFPQANEINLGGGFAFEYDEKNVEDKHFPWEKYFREIRELVQKYDIPDDVILTIEPGRDIFADVGEFIVKVHRVHNRPHERTKRISTNGSFVYMPSAMQRKRQHQLTFLDSQCNEKIDRFGYGSLSGCTTISSNYLFPGIVKIPQDTIKGDHIVVHDIGAYGASQHMSFLNKRPATEVLVRKDGTVEVISERGEFTDKVRNVPLQSRRIGGENES
jgi:diaminopimelate decarboxylase